jgi:hypothetical protein
MNFSETTFNSPPPEKIKLTPDLLEKSHDKLNGMTAEMVTEMKNDVFAGKKLIDPEGHIKMSMFDDVFSKEELAGDKEHLYRKKRLWSGYGIDGRMIEWKKRGLIEENEIVAQYEKDRKKNKPALLESATTILFYKITKDRFLVVKTSEWDDLENSADNIIIDKATGEIVGMFDEVDEKVTGEVKDRGEKKDKQVKIIEKALKGGSNIKYGLTFATNASGEKKIVKKSFANIPIFYLSLELENLGDLVESVGDKLSDKVSGKGLQFFDDFINSLEGQAVLLQEKLLQANYQGGGKAVDRNIENFKKSLAVMKDLRNKYA